MKKYLLVLAMAALLVFSFAAVAGAKYAGYAVDGSLATKTTTTPSKTPGYLSWGGAQHLMKDVNSVPSNLTSSPHGGYVTSTTKCAVCHSVHRAAGIGVIETATTSNANGVVNQFLTNGGDSCVQCHTTWGSTMTASLIEWAGPESAAGPHTDVSQGNTGCSTCHKGGIHGTGNSKYWGMNCFMLGNVNDAQITAELPLQEARGDVGDGKLLNETGNGTGANWFFNGSDGPGQASSGNKSVPYQTPSLAPNLPDMVTLGNRPASIDSNAVWAAARSMLTGYTCSQPGCHDSSVLTNLTWGQTYSRKDASTGATVTMTGHSSAPGAFGGAAANGCGPCHPGNVSGGFRIDDNPSPSEENSRAYGCDQCHDAVGAATCSTAFPHGNQNIAIYEWKNGTSGNSTYQPPTTVTASAGNLWMYAANVASFDGDYYELADPSVTLVQGAVGPDANGNVGNIMDGVCLKCHVPLDPATAKAYGVDQLYSSTDDIHSNPYGYWDDGSRDPSNLKGADINKMNFYTGEFDSGPGAGTSALGLIYLWF